MIQKMKLRSVYASVEDMDRAVHFYERLFDQEPTSYHKRFTAFEFECPHEEIDWHTTFGLYDPDFDNLDMVYGNNCVPNFEVDDVEEAYDRVRDFAPKMVIDGIYEFDGHRCFQFEDTEGNVVEIYDNV